MTLISITSEQTLPNVLLIKQLHGIRQYWFITTPKMEKEGRTDAIINVCGLKNAKRIVVEPENRDAIIESLRQAAISQKAPLILHLTGGTKIMALAAYQYFTTPTFQSEVYYKPIQEEHFLKIYPTNDEVTLTTKVSLKDYLHTHGIRILEMSSIADYKNKIPQTNTLMQEVARGKIPKKITAALSSNYTASDKMFLTGGWFELWSAVRIQQHFKLSHDEIAFNLKLTRTKGSTNENTEYDVMYVRNNRLYVAECKYFSQGNFLKRKINKDWYKLAGLQLQMGLYATPFLLTANPIPKLLDKYFKESHQLFRIKGYAGIDTIGNKTKFNQFLNNL